LTDYSYFWTCPFLALLWKFRLKITPGWMLFDDLFLDIKSIKNYHIFLDCFPFPHQTLKCWDAIWSLAWTKTFSLALSKISQLLVDWLNIKLNKSSSSSNTSSTSGLTHCRLVSFSYRHLILHNYYTNKVSYPWEYKWTLCDLLRGILLTR